MIGDISLGYIGTKTWNSLSMSLDEETTSEKFKDNN